MKKNEITSANIGEMGRKIIATMLTLALSGPAWASDWKLGASVTASETYTDNVTLGATGGSKGDFVTSITPTITAKKDGARLKVDASYSNQNLFYAEDSTRNTTYHQLNAHANAELFENEIFLDTTASISQASISPLAATGVDNTNATGNLTSVRSVTVSPYWIHRFGSTATLNARYAISEVGNSSDAFSGSTNYSTNLSLASGSAFGRVSWGLNYSEQTVDYSDRSDVSFTTTSASLGYLISSRLRLTGTVGTSKNSYVSSTGAATGGSFWNIAGSWAPSTRTSLDLGFGHQYYGKSWNMAFKTRGVNSVWTADYSESVTTSNSQTGQSASFGAGQIVSLTSSNNLLSNQVFLSKRFATAFSWKKRKHDFSLGAYRSIQTTEIDSTVNTNVNLQIGNIGFSNSTNDVFLSTSEVKQVGVNASWKWQWTALTNTNLSTSLTRSDFPSLNRQDTVSSLQFGLDRKFSPQLSGSVSLRRQMRDSNQNAHFTENALTGSVTYTF
ncbi:MAG: TIGR03016 family PEP-CTERM system-associated outer membrane protein [Burkholderiales bacterium]|nr:TIGR03016 family PEP-CTERM system-associated outer membrane protein [Burkholderiales bacterium]